MADFDSLAPGPITASLVVSKDGDTISSEGTSKGLGNQADLELLKWFRSRSQIVLTSGKTAAAEQYRYPTTAELAILSRTERNYPSLAADLNRVKFLSRSKDYAAAVHELAGLGFNSIHTEFGITGFLELVATETAEGFVSCADEVGIRKFLSSYELVEVSQHRVAQDLVVSRVSGRGKG